MPAGQPGWRKGPLLERPSDVVRPGARPHSSPRLIKAVVLSGRWSSVDVTLNSKAGSYFARLLGSAGPTLRASAAAGLLLPETACVPALNGSASQAILIDVGSIAASGCGIFNDSSSISRSTSTVGRCARTAFARWGWLLTLTGR